MFRGVKRCGRNKSSIASVFRGTKNVDLFWHSSASGCAIPPVKHRAIPQSLESHSLGSQDTEVQEVLCCSRDTKLGN